MNIGLIGAGRIGAVHARTIARRIPEARLLAIADPAPGAASRLAEELHVFTATTDGARVLDDDALDAVLVCSSTDTHAELVIAAARRGKHVFCEKPVDLSLARVDQVLDATRRAGVKLQVGFNRRFDPDFAGIRDAVRAGQIGRPEILRVTSRDPEPPPPDYVRASGGMFLDMTIHDLDMARFVMGQEVRELHVMAASLVDPAIGAAGDVDTAVLSLRFDDGAVGAIDNSRRARYGYDQRLEVHGSSGMIANGHHAATRVTVSDQDGHHAPPALHFFMQRYQAAYEAELSAFVAAVLGDSAPPVTGEDGRAALVLALAARRSQESGAPARPASIG